MIRKGEERQDDVKPKGLIPRGTVIYNSDGSIYCLVAKDIQTGDRITKDCFTHEDLEAGMLIPEPIKEFLKQKTKELYHASN